MQKLIHITIIKVTNSSEQQQQQKEISLFTSEKNTLHIRTQFQFTGEKNHNIFDLHFIHVMQDL